ncbi:MAG: hypothetical protein U1E76_04595 [Planctomycetota bacterium]
MNIPRPRAARSPTVRNLLVNVNAAGAEVLGDAMLFEQLVPLHLLEAGLQVEANGSYRRRSRR